MGFSVTASSGIIGISILVIIEISVGSIYPAYQDVTEAYKEMKDRCLEQLHTDLRIVSVNTTINGTGYDLNITVENTGSIIIDATKCHVLINGTLYQFQVTNEYIYPETQEHLILFQLPGTNNQRLKIITKNGISDYFTYSIS
jgi:archaellum component FlaF (FlaF/FlaG flagellin family)